MRLPQFRIRSLMIAITFLALLLTVAYQTFLLRRAALREELLRARAEYERAAAIQARVLAETQAVRAEDALSRLRSQRDSSRDQRKP